MPWQQKAFEQLTSYELYRILQLRSAVFVVEQQCVYQDIDDKDFSAQHLFLTERGRIIAYCRLLPRGLSAPQAAIGRIVVDPHRRGEGLSRVIMHKAFDIIMTEWGENEVYIQAQAHLEAFYRSFGFEPVSAPYPEDGIMHVDMIRRR